MRVASGAVRGDPVGTAPVPVDELFLGTVPLRWFEVANLGVLGHWEGTGCLSCIDRFLFLLFSFLISLLFVKLISPVPEKLFLLNISDCLLAKCQVATVKRARKPPQSSSVIKPLNWQVLLFHCRACLCPMELPLQALIREALV